MSSILDPGPDKSCWPRFHFDPDAGGKRWRRAVRAFNATLETVLETDAFFDPTSKVVSLSIKRAGHAATLKGQAEDFRCAADNLLREESPTPREAACKLILIAYLYGLPNPIVSNPGESALADTLSRLYCELHILDQYHDRAGAKTRKRAGGR